MIFEILIFKYFFFILKNIGSLVGRDP